MTRDLLTWPVVTFGTIQPYFHTSIYQQIHHVSYWLCCWLEDSIMSEMTFHQLNNVTTI